jgi:hypothetical protein
MGARRPDSIAMHVTSSAALVLLAAAGATQEPAPVEPAPAERLQAVARTGDEIRSSFEQVLRLELTGHEFAIVAEGEETPPSPVRDAELTIEERERIVFVDEIQAADGDRPARLRRTFESIASRAEQRVATADGRERRSEGEGRSPLAGRSVLFRLDPTSGEHAASFDDGRPGPRELLKGLDADASQAWFLPAAPVRVGDAWDVPLSALRRLAYPGGELGIEIEGNQGPPGFGEAFHAHLRGSIRARYAERRRTEAGELAVIHLEAALETRFDIGSIAAGPGEGQPQWRYDFRFGLDGELLWDPTASRASALDWKGAVTLARETREPAEELVLVTRQTFAGTLAYQLRVEPR